MSLPLIEFQNVTLSRDGRVALDGITLSIGTGEHVAILGPNGSGKSSLIKAVTRECYPLCKPGSSVRLLGKDCWDVFDLRYLLGIVSNDLMQSCTTDFSGRSMVLSGFFSSVGVWPHHKVTPAMEERAQEVLELLEILYLADRQMTEMSSGEARRVLIGRALVHDPKALILDEPTNSLDLRAARELRAILRKLAQSGTSIIMATHHLPDVIPEIERVILIKEGRVFRDGPRKEVLTSDTLSDLLGLPVEVVKHNGYCHLW